MNCQQAQHELLTADRFDTEALGSALAAHLDHCPDCHSLVARLRALDAEAARLPVPAGAAERSCADFIQILSDAIVAPIDPSIGRIGIVSPRELNFPPDGRTDIPITRGADLRLIAKKNPWSAGMRRALAASVALVVTLAVLSLIFFNGSEAQADVILGQLVDWNLQIAHAPTVADRGRVYQQQLVQMKRRAADPALGPADQALAKSLLENARWLTTAHDPADEAMRFKQLADQVRLHAQSTSHSSTHWDQMYQRLMLNGAVGPAPATPRVVPPANHADWKNPNQQSEPAAPPPSIAPSQPDQSLAPPASPVSPGRRSSAVRHYYFRNPVRVAPQNSALAVVPPSEASPEPPPLKRSATIHAASASLTNTAKVSSANLSSASSSASTPAAPPSSTPPGNPARHADAQQPDHTPPTPAPAPPDPRTRVTTPIDLSDNHKRLDPVHSIPLAPWVPDRFAADLPQRQRTDPAADLPRSLLAEDSASRLTKAQIDRALAKWISQNCSPGDLPIESGPQHPVQDPGDLFKTRTPILQSLSAPPSGIPAMPEPEIAASMFLLGFFFSRRRRLSSK